MQVRYLVTGIALLAAASVSRAQSAADHAALGDQLHAQLKPAEALVHYRAALAVDSNNYDALIGVTRDAIDLGEFEPDKAKQKALYDEGLAAARRAALVKPDEADPHFFVARALGRVALSLGKKDRVRFGKEVRTEALEALKHDSLHAGAMHVMGLWNAEIMRLSGLSRFMAKNFLGGDVFSTASWAEAVRYMEGAVANDPKRLTHHLDLGAVYRDRDKDGDKERARAQFQMVVDGTATEYNDPTYKRQAEEYLAKLSK